MAKGGRGGADDFGCSEMKPNYALERSARVLSGRAAGATEEFAPAARWPRVARPAQRGR